MNITFIFETYGRKKKGRCLSGFLFFKKNSFAKRFLSFSPTFYFASVFAFDLKVRQS